MTKASPDTAADKAAMLLSTDWFLPFWWIIGIEATAEKQCLQNGCREIVLDLVGDASNYYQVNFSVSRIAKTRQRLGALTQVCKIGSSAVSAWAELLTEQRDRDQLEKTAWMFRVLYQELLADPEVESETKAVLGRVRSRFSLMDALPLEDACLRSTSGWDEYIRNLTPEHPASLAYFVSTGLLSVAELKEVLNTLDLELRRQLHARFRELATQRTGLDLERDWSSLVH